MFVTKAGACTCVGLDVERTIASLRAGQDGFQELPLWGNAKIDLLGAPIRGFAEGVSGADRYVALALRALAPCFEAPDPSDGPVRAVLVGLPLPGRVGVPPGLATYVRDAIARAHGLPVESVATFSAGRVGVLHALVEARRLMGQGVGTCVVGGVDTWLDPPLLQHLSDTGALKEKWDGLIPGEAAAFVRLSRRSKRGGWGGTAAIVTGLGLVQEPATGTKDDPLVGVGVAAAFRNAVADAGHAEADVQLCINAVNGERTAFEDESYGWVRYFRSRRDHLEVWHVASYLGETGAAVGALELVWASAALELGLCSPRAVLLSASEGPHRAAMVVTPGEAATLDPKHLRVSRVEPTTHLPAEQSPRQPLRPADDPGMRIEGMDDLEQTLVQQNFDELVWLLDLRLTHHAEPGAPWEGIEGFEATALANLDALGWSSQPAVRLAASALGSDALEEARAGVVVTLCLPHDRARAELVLEAAHESSERAAVVLSALTCVPHSQAVPVLTALARDEDVLLAAAAIRAMTRTGHVDPKLLVELHARNDPGIYAAILEAVAAARLVQYYGPVGLPAPEHRGPFDAFAVLAIAPRLDAIVGCPPAELLRAEPIAFALACARDGLSFTSQVGSAAPSPPLIEALGWSGEAEATPRLLAWLDAEDEAIAAAAARALRRIHGVAPVESVETSDELGGTQEVERLSRDRQVWAGALRHVDSAPARSLRLRHGERWTPQSALDHLRRPEHDCVERSIAAWEHAIVHRGGVLLQPTWFVARQRQRLGTATPR